MRFILLLISFTAAACGTPVDDIDMPNLRGRYLYAEHVWPGGIIPFKFKEPFYHKPNVFKAISRIEKKTDLKFVETTQTTGNWILLRGDTSGCSSSVGMRGGQQTINLKHTKSNQGCVVPRTVEHEFGHALGFWHEHAVEDRDLFVRVNYDNILPGYEHNFRKRYGVTNLGTAYDTRSVMHYKSRSSSANGLNTIDALFPDGTVDFEKTQRMGGGWTMSPADAVQLHIMYQCPGPRTLDNFCSDDCKCKAGQGNCSLDSQCEGRLVCRETGKYSYKVKYLHEGLFTCEEPIIVPTPSPTQKPTVSPAPSPTQKPTVLPTPSPTQKPTVSPAPSPTQKPTVLPTPSPTQKPTVLPTPSPTQKPTVLPTPSPTSAPTRTKLPWKVRRCIFNTEWCALQVDLCRRNILISSCPRRMAKCKENIRKFCDRDFP
jgi:hypothetical protein